MNTLFIKNKPDLQNDKIYKLFINIAVPASIGTIFQNLYSLADSIFAGNMISKTALAAIGQTFPIFFVIIALGVGLSIGTSSLIANHLGEKDIKQASHSFIQSMIITFLISIIISILGLYFSESILKLISENDESVYLSNQYIKIIFFGSGIIFLLFNLNSCLSALGDTKSYRNVLIFSFILNILLNPILISGSIYNMQLFEGLGIKGLAYSTILSQGIGVIYLLKKVSKTIIFENIIKEHFKINKSKVIKILSQGIPASIGMMMISIGSFILLIFVGKFGVDAVSGYTAALRYEQLFFLPILGLNTAVLSMIGQNYGAKKNKRVEEIYKKGLIIGCLVLFISSILIFLTSEYAIQIFNKDIEVIKYGSIYLKIAAFILPVYSFFFITNALFQGLKKAIIVMYASLLRFVFLPLILIYLVMSFFSLDYKNIFLTLLIINWVLSLSYYYYALKKLKKILISNT